MMIARLMGEGQYRIDDELHAQLNDLDELVRDTQKRGMEVLLLIWGTPKWANG